MFKLIPEIFYGGPTHHINVHLYAFDELYLLFSFKIKNDRFVTSNANKPKGATNMNIGDKVIAVGMGRKSKELNGGDIERAGDRLPGFTGLVVDMVVMTVTDIEGSTVLTKFYKFHKDDLHLVDTGRASAPLN
jgi:hypothetical protein